MNKTLIVLGAGIWGVLILLRFVLNPNATNEPNTYMFLNIIEIVAFVIAIVGIVKQN